MSSDMAVAPRASAGLSAGVLKHWPLLLGLALICIPVLIALGNEAWTRETGVHGPLILATWLWLLYRAYDENRPLISEGRTGAALVVMLPALAVFIVAWAFNFVSVFVAMTIVLVIAVLYLLTGARASKAAWFPLAYGFFLIPPPGYAVDVITMPIKTAISNGVTWMLAEMGYPIVRSGVSIYISQYQLLVEDACSGMQSLFSLLALGLFYVYLMHRSEWRYALLLALFIIPAAIFANFVRVTVLILITYYWGDELAQGVLHTSTGMLLFVVTLLSIFLLDKILSPIRVRLGGKAS